MNAPGDSIPQKAQSPAATGLSAEQNTDTSIINQPAAIGKRFATLQAQCALAGVSLHELENDYGDTVFIVARWALTRELPDLDAVASWLNRVTGGQR